MQHPVRPILIGLMGSGKSSIGRRLAKRLAMPLLDLDDYLVEKHRRTIPEIFAEDGEAAFRQMETAALREVIGRDVVLATGGGAVLSEENRKLMREHPPVIWLKAAPEFLAERIAGDPNRPLLAQGDALQKLQALAAERDRLYAACTDYILPRGDMKKRQAVEAILAFLRQFGSR